MRVVRIREAGGPEVLEIGQAQTPGVAPGEVLIKVGAAGVNRPDVSQRMGKYPVPKDANPIPGLEVAGTVVKVGAGLNRFRVGSPVFALAHGGGYATHCVVDARHALPMPTSLSFIQAAALPEVAFTVEFNMMMRCRLAARESVLIHGGSSGIGSFAIQRAKAEGATVLVTAGSDEKCDFCLRQGADRAINYKNEDWKQAVLDATNGSGVDVLVDMVAGEYVQKNIDCLADDGRYALISMQGGRFANVSLEPIMRRRLTICGSTLRPLSPDTKAEIAGKIESDVIPLVESGAITPHIYQTFSLERAADAHRLMESGTHMGKIVLEVNENDE